MLYEPRGDIIICILFLGLASFAIDRGFYVPGVLFSIEISRLENRKIYSRWSHILNEIKDPRSTLGSLEKRKEIK